MHQASCRCGCCEGVEKLTPMPLANRPGLSALSYRAGTYSTWFETMVARLSNLTIATGQYDAKGGPVFLRPLASLTTREQSDPAIALLDSWALVADVLSFYDERIANEGYLSTATERRSVLELARLIGYAPRPGVSATAYLAYTIEEDRSVTPPKGMEVTIPAGSRSQSVPEPNELPQTFETAEPLVARTAWNKLQPRMSCPQDVETLASGSVWLQGTKTNLKPNDPVLIVRGSDITRFSPMRVATVSADSAADRTFVTLRPWSTPKKLGAATSEMAAQFLRSAPSGSTADEARTALEKLQEKAGQLAADPARLAELLESEILPELSALEKRVPASAKKLKPWLGNVTAELGAAHTQWQATLNMEAGTGRAVASKPFETMFDSLKKTPSIPPPNATKLNRSIKTAFQQGADIFPRLLATFRPLLGKVLAPALANASVAPAADLDFKLYALRISASLFGHNTPEQPDFNKQTGEVITFKPPTLANTWMDVPNSDPPPRFPTIALDAEYDQIQPGSFMIVERPPIELVVRREVVVSGPRFEGKTTIHEVQSTAASTLAALGVSSKVTLSTIAPVWFDKASAEELEAIGYSTPLLRGTRVYAQSELLPLAEIPITDPICDAEVELDGLYDGLEAGRWVVVSGERADVFDANCERVAGIQSAELAMVLSVSHRVRSAEQAPAPGDKDGIPPTKKDVLGAAEAAPPPGVPPFGIDHSGYDEKRSQPTAALPGDKTHTFITLSTDPAYCYVREKMTIYGNVVKATHGETRREILGSGDASKARQSFTLRQPPLTFLPASTAAGAASTLVLRVNEVEWHETDSLAGLLPDDRKFVTATDDESKTAVIFGNGLHGARPPTGRENISAVYRNGIGRPGNVKAGQISQLGTRPLGVKEVVNPLPATGGADRESRDQARKNAPLGVLALDRLVSVRDYADFARTFAGIGKASAVKLSDGSREIVHVTIAGADDIPIALDSDLYRNLVRAFRDLGDPHLPVKVELREMFSVIVSARVALLPDYSWEFVEPKVRAALLEALSFERRELEQDVTKSEIVSIMHQVRGVAYVDLDSLSAVTEQMAEEELALTATGVRNKESEFSTSLKAVDHRVVVYPARIGKGANGSPGRILPAQIAILASGLPETLLLTEVPK